MSAPHDMSDGDIPAGRLPAVEWPTLALIFAVHGALALLVWFHDAMPVWLWLPLAAWFSAWWGSVQHEILHGHPTRSRWLNTVLATPPYWLWLPFERYRQTHLKHHRDERLTDPLDDPESRYITPEQFAALGFPMRWITMAQSTLAGRLALGPIVAPLQFLWNDCAAIRAGDRALARIWLWHAIWTGALAYIVFVVCGVPMWKYLLGFVYFGLALALIRSFAEHRADASIGRRTAIVENSRIFGLLFLFNNLHVVHHRWPTIPWYRLPAVYRARRAAIAAWNGGLVYSGYGDLFRRFFLKPHHHPIHPLGRIPERAPDQAGKG